MSRIEDDNKFVEEDAKWLPLDAAVLSVRKCLHEMIAALAVAADYLCGRSNDAPAELVSRRFSVVHTYQCPAFEELCARIKERPPTEILKPRVDAILQLAEILASRTEEVLPGDDISGNDLRNAITSLYTLSCNTPKNMPPEAFAVKVDETSRAICAGFKSLSNAFRKLELRRKHGDNAAPAAGVLTPTDKAFIHEEVGAVSGKVENAAEEVNKRLDIQSGRLKGVEHQIELARKGKGQLTKKSYPKDVQESAFWKWVEATVKYGEKHQKDDGFKYFASKLKEDGIEDANEWKKVVEQYRKRKGLCIRDEVKKWDGTHSDASEWRGKKCA